MRGVIAANFLFADDPVGKSRRADIPGMHHRSPYDGRYHTVMAVRPLRSFFPTAEELLAADLPELGETLLMHLNSYQDRVKQHGRLYQGYLLAMLENRNVGLGPLPPAPEYGAGQPAVTRRVMEAWNWLERQGLLIADPTCHGWHSISTEGERLLAKRAGATSKTTAQIEHSISANPSNPANGDTEEPFRFQIALSFPGGYRPRIEKIASALADVIGRNKVLYDKWHRAEFARPNLDIYLPKLYHERSRLLVFFLCGEYAQKEWCGLEWRAGRDLLKRNEDDRLMFLRLDLADIPGLYSIDGYLDISRLTDEEVVREILKRLETLVPDSVETQFTVDTGCVAQETESDGESEVLWEGVEVQGIYYAWAGPLLAMEDRAAVPSSPLLIKALGDLGVRVSFGNPEKLSDHLGRGRCQVFATDKKRWRRPVTRGRQFLLAKSPDDRNE